jgi:hypothetical protein
MFILAIECESKGKQKGLSTDQAVAAIGTAL